MPTTIAEVAARAGVSIATVSRVLAGMPGARPETRERVLLAARQLQYRPSGVAQSLKRRATRALGLIITDIANPFFPDLVRAVEDAAREAGYTVLLCNGADDPEREAAYLELLASRRVDGMIVASSALTERHGRWLTTAPLPAGACRPSSATAATGGARPPRTCLAWGTGAWGTSAARDRMRPRRNDTPGSSMPWPTPGSTGERSSSSRATATSQAGSERRASCCDWPRTRRPWPATTT